MEGHVARTLEVKKSCHILVVLPEGRDFLGDLRHRWEYNMKMDLKEIGWGLDSCGSG
jgi:hypothetical protein